MFVVIFAKTIRSANQEYHYNLVMSLFVVKLCCIVVMSHEIREGLRVQRKEERGMKDNAL